MKPEARGFDNDKSTTPKVFFFFFRPGSQASISDDHRGSKYRRVSEHPPLGVTLVSEPPPKPREDLEDLFTKLCQAILEVSSPQPWVDVWEAAHKKQEHLNLLYATSKSMEFPLNDFFFDYTDDALRSGMNFSFLFPIIIILAFS